MRTTGSLLSSERYQSTFTTRTEIRGESNEAIPPAMECCWFTLFQLFRRTGSCYNNVTAVRRGSSASRGSTTLDSPSQSLNTHTRERSLCGG